MLLSVVISAVVSQARPEAQASAAGRQATTAVRIERPANADRRPWEQLPKSSRREVIVRGESGEPVVLWLLEYE
jgi:hypothetical protein